MSLPQINEHFTTDPLPNPLINIPPTELERSGDSSQIAQMTEAANQTPASADGDELDTSTDSDFDEGDEVIARGYPRNHANLEKHGFRPVWTHWAGYPGEIPDDIREYLDEHGKRGDSYTC